VAATAVVAAGSGCSSGSRQLPWLLMRTATAYWAAAPSKAVASGVCDAVIATDVGQRP